MESRSSAPFALGDFPEGSAFRIGPWQAYPTTNELVREDETVRVTPKVMQVLVCLARTPGEAVTRDALFEEVWRGTVVSEDVLNRAISELRKVFGDDPQQPRYIETLPKVGYRLVAPVAFPFPETLPGERVLLRLLNAGLRTRLPVVPNISLEVVAEDARRIVEGQRSALAAPSP